MKFKKKVLSNEYCSFWIEQAKKYKRVKAAALQYVVFISFIIALLTFFFIYNTYLQTTIIDRFLVQDQLLSDLQSVCLLVNATDDINIQTIDSIPIDDEQDNMVSNTVSYPGIFELHTLTARRNRYEQTEYVFAGTELDSTYPTLYVKDNSKFVSVSGNTTIRGNCRFPEYGIKTGMIGRERFTGQKLIYGSWSKSERKLPALSSMITQQINMYTDGSFTAEKKEFPSVEDAILNCSFGDTTICTVVSGSIEDVSIAGNVIVYSDNYIQIENSCRLNDCIVVADSINIASGFSGNAQFFARSSITVENDVELLYPTVLAVVDNDESITSISLEEDVIFSGIILQTQSSEDYSYSSVKIADGAVVYGLLYSTGSVEIYGEMYGSLYCNNFRLERSKTYINHLNNTTIDRSELPESFIIPFLLEDIEGKSIIFKRYLQ